MPTTQKATDLLARASTAVVAPRAGNCELQRGQVLRICQPLSLVCSTRSLLMPPRLLATPRVRDIGCRSLSTAALLLVPAALVSASFALLLACSYRLLQHSLPEEGRAGWRVALHLEQRLGVVQQVVRGCGAQLRQVLVPAPAACTGPPSRQRARTGRRFAAPPLLQRTAGAHVAAACACWPLWYWQ